MNDALIIVFFVELAIGIVGLIAFALLWLVGYWDK